MLTCKYNDEVLFCREYIGFDDEAPERIKELKMLASEGKLLCCDDDCCLPVDFCHGEIKGSYFRHRKGTGSDCNYNSYSSKRQSFNELKTLLYKHFSDKGLKTDIDAKLLPGHWTDLAVTFSDGRIVAIELTDRRPGGMDYIQFHDKYKEKGISDLWILQTSPTDKENLIDMYCTDMMQYHDNEDKKAVYYDVQRKQFTIRYKVEPKVRYPHLFAGRYISIEFPIDCFEIDEYGQMIGFCKEQYEIEYNKLMADYNSKESELLERQRRAKEEQERREELRIIQEKEARAKAEIERHERIKKAKEEQEKREQAERAHTNGRINKAREVLAGKGIVIDEDKFARFLEKHNTWLMSGYEPQKQDFILVEKYKGS